MTSLNVETSLTEVVIESAMNRQYAVELLCVADYTERRHTDSILSREQPMVETSLLHLHLYMFASKRTLYTSNGTLFVVSD